MALSAYGLETLPVFKCSICGYELQGEVTSDLMAGKVVVKVDPCPNCTKDEPITSYGQSINLTQEQEQRLTKDILESLRKVAKQ